MNIHHLLCWSTFIALLGIYGAPVQAQILTFRYVSLETTGPIALTGNGLISFPQASPFAPSTVALIAENATSSSWTVRSIGILSGPFSVKDFTPATVSAGSSTQFTLTFSPQAAGRFNGRMDVEMSSAGRTLTTTFFLTGVGVVPELLCSYFHNPGGNQTRIDNGQTISFPSTMIGQSATAAFIIENRGSGVGVVNDITLSGSNYTLSGLPLLPARLAARESLRFTITFSPSARALATGALQVVFERETKSINLEGRGISSLLSYEFVDTTGSKLLAPGTAYSFPPTSIGKTATVQITITNSGDANARITSITLTGSNYQLSSVPPLPFDISIGQSVVVGVSYSPRDYGPTSGQLQIQNARFPLFAEGIGARLALSVSIGSVVTQIPDNGTLAFANTPLGSTTTHVVTLSNTGNAPAAVQGIVVSGTGFVASGLPSLPAVIESGHSIQFEIRFSPQTLGGLSGTLQVDDRSYALRGVGSPPASLSELRIREVPATAEPLQQPYATLSLAQGYPQDLQGRLTLSFLSESFADDPAIQFATGGRTVDFRIPAGTTTALFGQNSDRVQFQVGTVAGRITLTATVQIGGVDLTPNPAPSATVTIEPAAPRLRNVQLGTRTQNSIELLITGYSNIRSLNTLAFDFTPAPAALLQTTSLSANVEAPFSAWYQSSASRTFGSQFTASVVVNINGRLEDIQSVSVRAINASGPSPTVSLDLR